MDVRFITMVAVLLVLASSVKGQSVATCKPGNSTGSSYRKVLLSNVLTVTTQYFSENSVGEDGVSRIDASLVYNLPDLFELRYGKGASTASFLAGFLDILNSNLASTLDGTTDYLSTVIGLVRLGEFEAARTATSALIFSSLPDDVLPFDLAELTDSQIMLLGNAVRSSLNSIWQALSATNFEVYLNLKVGGTLSFALDTTGSMAGEISAARERIISIIESTRGTIEQPLLYVLSPFNDPGHGPVTKSPNATDAIIALNILTANGGGDGPELALKGIESAILASTRRSVVFMITDAQAKDFNLTSRVIALAVIRKVRIISLLTNEISGSTGFELYEKISSASGGLVTVTNKASIGSITELFQLLTAQGQVKLVVTPSSYVDEVSFTVDSTVSNVSIVLSGKVGFNNVTDDLGMSVRTNVSETSGLIIVRLEDAEPGTYRVGVSHSVNYSVEISGQSTFGALPSIFEKIGDEYIHRGQPVAGQEAHVAVTLFGNAPTVEDRIEESIGSDAILREVMLVGEDGKVLVREEVENCGDVDEYRTMKGFNIPSVRFFVKMVGTDRRGRPFVRVDPCAITPLVANITLSPIPDVTIDIGQSLTVTTTLTNQEQSGNFDFDVSDPRGFVLRQSPDSTTFVRSTSALQITLQLPSDTVDGSLSVVTVTATPQGKDEFVFITFTVTARNNATVKCPALRSPAGSVITCSDFNNVGSVCQVTCEPDYTLMMTSNSTCQSDGTWSTAELSCTFVGRKQCSVSGDPHYATFDGKLYEFQGTCVYSTVKTTFSETVGRLEPFSIEVENEHLAGVTTVSWFRRAYISVHNTSFVFLKGRTVFVNGLATTLPFTMAVQGLRVSLSGVNVVMTTRFGLQVIYNGKFNFVIQLSASYAGLVEGLCGNLNGNPDDDLTLASNTSVIMGPNEFGNSFKVGGEARICQDGDDRDGVGDCLAEDEYKGLCDIVNGECFEDCRKEIDAKDVLKNCVFDLCVTKGEKDALEQALSFYADSCQKNRITVCDWRNETGTPIACQSNSQYEHEGTSCPNTCQSPTRSSRCVTPSVSGCICNDGLVLSGTECVPLSSCGCTAGGRYYKANEGFYEPGCSSFCVCENGFLNCTGTSCALGEACKVSKETGRLGCEPTSFATCMASGDPHYMTFDGKLFDFQGRCTYLLSRVAGVDISGSNENRDGNTAVSYIKTVHINFVSAQTKNVTITLGNFFDNGNQPAAKIDGFFEGGEQILDTVSGPEFQISRRGTRIVVKIKRVEVTYERDSVSIVVPGLFAEKTTGLCGNYNGETDDDFMLIKGNVTDDVNLFGDSYRVGECDNPDTPDPFVCPPEQERLYSSEGFCGIITSGILANISEGVVDLERYFNDCVYDMCATNGSLTIIELILKDIVREIQNLLSGSLCNWREIYEIPILKCPNNAHYEGCTSACPNTCSNPFAEERCEEPKVEGCACDFGFVWSRGECIRLEECGCNHPTLGFLPQGYSKIDSNCTTRCGCFGPNKYECQDATCKDEEVCSAVGETFECRPTETNCVLWGATYVSTFDGQQFNFNGKCAYILTKYEGDDDMPKFSVVVNHKSPAPCNATADYPLTVRVGDDAKMTISRGGKSIIMNGRRLLPGTRTSMYKISSQPTFTTIQFAFGLTIRTDAMGSGVMLTASPMLQGKIMGLCGFSDGNPENDFVINMEGRLAESANEFGNHWRFTGDDDTSSSDDNCSDGTRMENMEDLLRSCQNRKYFSLFASALSCGTIAVPSSIHSACHSTVPPQALVKSCIADLCQKKPYLATIESTIVGYNAICRIRNSPYDLVETEFETNLECPANSSYSKKAPPCVKTCADPEGATCASDSFSRSIPQGEGCVCNDGLVWTDGKCVPLEYCGCKDPESGFYFESGACGWNANCSKKCECEKGMWKCEDGGCEEDQYCGMRMGKHGCQYQDECKYDNGGCSHICTSSNRTVTCSCPIGMFLEDEKTCRMLDRRACLSEETIYTASLKEWRSSYQQWRDHYYNQYLEVFEASKESDLCCAETSATPQKCAIAWSRWYNTDSPDNCRDDETLGRIRQIFPDEVCESPLAIDVRVAGQERSEGEMSDTVMRLRSGKAGLLCHNADQKEGNTCPDFEVRFLCEKTE